MLPFNQYPTVFKDESFYWGMKLNGMVLSIFANFVKNLSKLSTLIKEYIYLHSLFLQCNNTPYIDKESGFVMKWISFKYSLLISPSLSLQPVMILDVPIFAPNS